MVDLIQKIRKMFRAKETFLEVQDFDPSIIRVKFQYINNQIIKDFIGTLKDVKSYDNLEEPNLNILKSNALHLNDDEELIHEIQTIFEKDLKENLIKANNEGWSFEYFINENLSINSNGGKISARLFYDNTFEETGNVLYDVILVKKIASKFYLWDMGED